MTHFRKIWDAEKREWIKAHKGAPIHDTYLQFLDAFPDAQDVTETAFRNERVRVGAGSYKRAVGYSTKPRPIGSEHNKKGYVRVKVAEPNVWKFKHQIVYEKAHPDYIYNEGDRFIFLDKNNRNFSPENIEVLNVKYFGIFNLMNGKNTDPDLARINIARAKLKSAVLDKAEEIGETVRQGTARKLRSEFNARAVAYRHRPEVYEKDKKRRREKWANMSDEEREKIRQYRRDYYRAHKGKK